MTPALPSVEHPLAGGGMSSTSAADFVFYIPLTIYQINGHDHRDHGFRLANWW